MRLLFLYFKLIEFKVVRGLLNLMAELQQQIFCKIFSKSHTNNVCKSKKASRALLQVSVAYHLISLNLSIAFFIITIILLLVFSSFTAIRMASFPKLLPMLLTSLKNRF